MNTVLILFAIQGLVGAFDNLWHHSLTQRLAGRPSARGELALHSLREFLYAVIFTGLAWLTWDGLWAFVLAAILAVEIVVTLWDFIIEDQTRRLPKLERVVHTLLAINFGVILAFLLPVLWDWAGRPSGLVPIDHGPLSWVMTAYGIAVLLYALHDLRAALRFLVPDWRKNPIRAGARSAPKHVLITGATGFIGRSLTRRLIERGDKVVVLARDPHKARFLFGPHAETIDRLEQVSAGRRIDAIINLAGEPLIGGLWTRARKAELVGGRLSVTAGLVDLIARLDARPEVLISASAIGYYGLTGDECLTEEAPPQAIFMSRLCQDWEAAALRAADLGLRVCRVRIGLVLGGDGGAFPPLALPVRLGLGTVFGKGTQWMSWIHKEDLIRTLIFALNDPRVEGPVNAVAPGSVTAEGFTRALGKTLGRPVWLRCPAWLLKAALGQLADLFVAGQRVVPSKLKALGFVFTYPDLSRAFDDLLVGARPKQRPPHSTATRPARPGSRFADWPTRPPV